MSITVDTLPIAYRLQEETEVRESEDGVVFVSPICQVTISRLSPHLRGMLMAFAQTACSLRWIKKSLHDAHEESASTTFFRYLSSLLRRQMLTICIGSEKEKGILATLIPMSSSFKHGWVPLQMDQRYQLSRFAYVRRDEDSSIYLECPLSHARIRLERPLAASFLCQLGGAVTPRELISLLPGGDKEDLTGLLALLVMGNFVSLAVNEDQLTAGQGEAAMQWEFHDLLFHSRSRMGRHDNPVGGTYRFLSQIAQQPAVKQTDWPGAITLYQPDMDRLCTTDPSLTAVLEKRTSIRDYGEHPVTVSQLGEFLYRVARIKEVESGEAGEYTRRPYPGAGACYEMEMYLTIEQCEGLAPGFYWYNPLKHALALLHEANKETEQQLFDANESMGGEGRPQVLITLAARFQRVSWKYQSLAYSLILKDVGVIYATMYLVATAMGLAPCALGAGDSDLFLKLAGTAYLKETSVGEFMLGSQSAQGE